MRFRSRHLACFLLLLTTFGAAQGSNAPQQTDVFRGRYIDVLLYRHAARSASQVAAATAEARQQSAADTAQLSQSARFVYRAAWAMQPAAAHTASIYALTGRPGSLTL